MMRECRLPFANHPYTNAARHRRSACQGLRVEDAFAVPDYGDAVTGGVLVNIFASNDAGRVFFEGVAHLGAQTGIRLFEHFVVFLGERRSRRRLVLPGPYQSDPESVIVGLSALYADARSPDSPDTFLSDVVGHAANDNTPATDEEA